MNGEWAIGWFRDDQTAKQQTCKMVAFVVLNSDDISTPIVQCTSFAVMPMQYISCHHAPVGSENQTPENL